MKKLVFILAITAFLSAFSSTHAEAQRYDEAQYEYSDSNAGVIYQMYVKFSGYQVQVWMKTHTQKNWLEYKILETTDENITIQYKNNEKLHMQLDPNNEDVIVLYNSDYSKSWRYLKK